MTSSRTLHPEDEIAQYRVVGPLGAGGMGEVYLAQDQTLERNVALKVLPPELVRSEERVRRFQQEAKSASSLNHPNIVTIYEIGQETVRSSTGSDTGSGPLHYISMELISGKTLGAKIHEEKTDLKTLLGYLAQAAEGIAKAHAAGIVHRDLKPGNIMVSDDGFAKVLDFGLAKLTEKRSADASPTAMTEVGAHTTEGAVMGTVGYMSPEQVQGKSVDHRSDIFSFGCLLYEAATGRRPFVADSNVETMHKIIHDKPQPIEEINASVPAELRRLIRRCLAKSPDQRLQSMKDLAIELREIADEYDTLSASTTSASGSTTAVVGRPARRSRTTPILIGVGLVTAAAVGFGVWAVMHGKKAAVQPFETMHIMTQTSRGDVTDCALSPDGRYLAYVAGRSGHASLRVRQVATGSDVEVLPMQDGILESPSFSPDGNYVFYLKRKPDAPQYRMLMSIPSLGGPEQQRAFDVDTRVTFSPDGRRICFYRGIPQSGMGKLLILDLDAGKERELATIRRPEQFPGSPVWSPDGKLIAALTVTPPPQLKSTLSLYDADSGERKDLLTKSGAFYASVCWMPDGRDLVISGADLKSGANQQVFLVSYPGAQLRRVTNDFNEYAFTTAAAGGEEAIASVRNSRLSNIFVSDLTGSPPRALTTSTSPENSPLFFAPVQGHVLYSAFLNRYFVVLSVPAEGGEARPFGTGNGHVIDMAVGSSVLAYSRFDEDLHMHIWRVDVDGTDVRQVTNGPGELLFDVSPDDRLATFTWTDSTLGVWVVPLDGGEAKILSAKAEKALGTFSPDGQRVAVLEYELDKAGLVHTLTRVFPATGGEAVATVRFTPRAGIPSWTPDGQAFSYVDRADPAWNVYRLRIGEDTPHAITKFADGRVTQYAWSLDGSHLVLVRQFGEDANVWVTTGDGTQAKQITNLTGQEVFQVGWMPEGRSVVMMAGRASSDAVLIKNFR